ncbi:hypothetical protein J6590_057422 [Homalodisca vitripennis]|nr:hypothetical protein J6590_057422 [Homalodisca vitripennis]
MELCNFIIRFRFCMDRSKGMFWFSECESHTLRRIFKDNGYSLNTVAVVDTVDRQAHGKCSGSCTGLGHSTAPHYLLCFTTLRSHRTAKDVPDQWFSHITHTYSNTEPFFLSDISFSTRALMEVELLNSLVPKIDITVSRPIPPLMMTYDPEHFHSSFPLSI